MNVILSLAARAGYAHESAKVRDTNMDRERYNSLALELPARQSASVSARIRRHARST